MPDFVFELACSQDHLYLFLEYGEEVGYKPGIAFQPYVIAWAGMGKRELFWPKFFPGFDRFRDRSMGRIGKMIGFGILTNHESELDVGQTRKEFGSPGLRAFRTGREVSGFPCARIAKSHRKNSDLSSIIKGVSMYP